MQKKLFLTYVALVLFLSSIIGVYSIKICQDYYTDNFENHLMREITLVASMLTQRYEQSEFQDIDSFTNDIAKQLALRVTIVNKEGTVVSDSFKQAASLDNHRSREEIRQAFANSSSVAVRHSNTTGTESIYVAKQLQINGEAAVLRFSVPLTELKTIKNQMVVYILFCIGVCAVIAFFCAYYFSKKISEPLDELNRAAGEISKGNYNKKIQVESNDQIGQLTRTFNQMSQRLNQTVNQLEDENYKMEAIVNSMMNGLVAVDSKNKILLINAMCYSFFDIHISPAIGRDFYEVFRNEDLLKMLEKAVEQKKPFTEEFVWQSAFQGDKILRVNINPISGAKGIAGNMGTLLLFQDMTRIRKLEQLRSDFVSNVTHELKTPLTSIMGFTDTLKGGAIDDKVAAMRFLDIIDIETNRLYSLIQDILSLSELETRKEDINMAEESMNHILERVEKLLRPQAEAKGLLLCMQIEPDLPLFYCNRDRIFQLFINFIENAIKYTEKGSVTVSCKNQERFVQIKVSDTGIGIPKESQSRIFERFYRVDKGRSRKAGGTGLGLSIAKHIIILYEGRVEVNSKEGAGTEFIITLPYRKE